jgi:hypothetical protein
VTVGVQAFSLARSRAAAARVHEAALCSCVRGRAIRSRPVPAPGLLPEGQVP